MCVCPKEAPVNVFKQDVTAHLLILKDQACFFLHVKQECFHGNPKKVVLRFSSRLASSGSSGNLS